MSRVDPIDFLLQRYDEFERWAKACAEVYPPPWEVSDRGWMARVVADEPNFHDVTRLDQKQAPDVAWLGDALEHIAESSVNSVVMRVSRKFAWATEREYRARFGSEPPTGPIVRLMLQPFAAHPDFDPQWAG